MRTTIELNAALLKEAIKCAGVKSKSELINLALREFIERHRRADIRELRSKGLIDPSYDYRNARTGKLST